jgi:L-histidine N-alpha-methyltransferase
MQRSVAFATDLHAPAAGEFAADVRLGLSVFPRRIPPRWLYDALGSALFEAICQLPWYRITRAERVLLDEAAPAIAERLPDITSVIELGPGSGEKLASLVSSIILHGRPVTAHLVDVSGHALDLASRTLARVPGLRVCRHLATFEAGLRDAVAAPPTGARLVAFLGSNIGNVEPAEQDAFLAGIAAHLRPGDGLLLGTDLVKPERDLLLAYDDPIGVTAAFNRNLLARINRELGADFVVDRYRHEARWQPVASRVEMHLVSAGRQHVRLPGAGLEVTFADGESIWTESSYKFEPLSLIALADRAGLQLADQWIDQDARFALTLMTR